MAGLKELVAPVRPVRIISLRTIGFEEPDIVNDEAAYLSWGLLEKTGEYPILQPAKIEINQSGNEVPLKSVVEQYPLLPSIQIEALHADEDIPLPPKILWLKHDETLFVPINEFQPYNENLFVQLTQAAEGLLPEGYLDYLIASIEVEISKNQLNLIFPPEKVLGMNYASRYWEETRIRLPGFEQRKKRKEGEKEVRSIHRGRIGNKVVGASRHKPSIWDLVFVLLQPPLKLDFPESLALPYELFPYQVKGVSSCSQTSMHS